MVVHSSLNRRLLNIILTLRHKVVRTARGIVEVLSKVLAKLFKNYRGIFICEFHQNVKENRIKEVPLVCIERYNQ
jgi:hypothetical protein